MQMTGQERITAPRQQVWQTLYDPETLKRCIPGCQSLTQEADDRLRVIAEIKIGPIGARFNALVTRTDVEPQQGYTLKIEGQGGTVGFVKSGAKLRLADDPRGGTLLSYEVEAEVGGRLAQLGGPILDATAKQLAGKFFQQLGAVTTAPAAESSIPPLPPSAAPVRTASVASVLAVAVAALAGFLIGQGAQGSAWSGFGAGLLLVLVAAASFEYGRRTAFDRAALERLIEEARR